MKQYDPYYNIKPSVYCIECSGIYKYFKYKLSFELNVYKILATATKLKLIYGNISLGTQYFSFQELYNLQMLIYDKLKHNNSYYEYNEGYIFDPDELYYFI